MSDVFEEVEECLGGDAADRRLLEGTGHDFVLVRMSGTQSKSPDRVTVSRVRAGSVTEAVEDNEGERDRGYAAPKK